VIVTGTFGAVFRCFRCGRKPLPTPPTGAIMSQACRAKEAPHVRSRR
jgi:hypothetical protein